MKLAERSVPKKMPEEGRCGGGLVFCRAEEQAPRLMQMSAGKLLLVSDEKNIRFLSLLKGPRTLSVCLTGKSALPLFAMPDGVGAVAAAGGAAVMKAARLFATARRIPCALFPSDVSFDGVFGAREEVEIEDAVVFELKEASVYCDRRFMEESLGEGLARLMLSRLALFEGRANAILRGIPLPPEDAFPLFSDLSALSFEEIAERNAALRRLERSGTPTGECMLLARKVGSMRAYIDCRALYAAFLKRGKPSLRCPDYSRRAEEAGVCPSSPPGEEEYSRRCEMLSRRRGDLLRELDCMLRDEPALLRRYARLCGAPYTGGGRREDLKYLPEYAPDGLSALIRDFGLMEDL